MAEEKPQPQPQKKEEDDFQALVRLLDRDIKGSYTVYSAIARVRGCGYMVSNAICKILGLDKSRRIGDLSANELKKIEEIMESFGKQEVPKWILNRRKDMESGEDTHLVTSDLQLRTKFDIQFLKKIKCFRGYRHSRGDKGLKVKARGQRTRSTGRGKGKAVGVSKKKKQ